MRPGDKIPMGIEPEYIVVEGKTFIKEQLSLDNHVFKNCTMDECQIYYSGGPYELIDTHITNSQLILISQPRTSTLRSKFLRRSLLGHGSSQTSTVPTISTYLLHAT